MRLFVLVWEKLTFWKSKVFIQLEQLNDQKKKKRRRTYSNYYYIQFEDNNKNVKRTDYDEGIFLFAYSKANPKYIFLKTWLH